MEKHPFAGAEFRHPKAAQAPFLSGCPHLLRCGKDLSQFPEVLCGGGEEEFVICAAWSPKSEPSEAEDALEVREKPLDVLSQFHRDHVLVGFGCVAGDLPGVFMLLAGDGSGIGVRAAPRLRGASLAGVLQAPVFGDALAGRAAVPVRIIAAELLQLVPLRADVLVVLGITLEVGPGTGSVAAPRLIEDSVVRGNFAVNQSELTQRGTTLTSIQCRQQDLA